LFYLIREKPGTLNHLREDTAVVVVQEDMVLQPEEALVTVLQLQPLADTLVKHPLPKTHYNCLKIKDLNLLRTDCI
jgi:hypothetical protein